MGRCDEDGSEEVKEDVDADVARVRDSVRAKGVSSRMLRERGRVDGEMVCQVDDEPAGMALTVMVLRSLSH